MNHYDLLGVPITATSKQIKTAYKRLALTNHPDKVPKEKQNEAVTKFKKLNKAYQTLTNPNSRYEYDEKLGKKNLLQRCQSYKYPKQQYPSTTKIFRSKSKESDLSNSQPSFSFNQRETTDLLNEVILTNKYAFFSSHNQNNSKANQKQKKQQKNVKKYKSNNKHNHKKNETNNHINSKNQNKKERKNQKKEREMERGMESEKDFEPKSYHKPKNNSKAATNQKNKNKPKNYSKTTNNHKKVQNNKNEHPSNFSEFKTSNKRTPFKNQNHFSNNYPNSNSNSNSKSKTKPKSRKYRKKNQKNKQKLSPTIKICVLTLEEVYAGTNQICSFERKYFDPIGNLNFKKSIQIEFPIPKGIKEGHEFVFHNKGDKKKGFQPANLIIKISIEKHKFFLRKGDDLCLTQKISIVQSLTYFIFQITLLNQKILKLKFGYDGSVIKHGKELVIHDLGMPKENTNEEFGDLIITFHVEFPESLTKSQKELIISTLGNTSQK
ncbi:DNAj [Anaeramoeba flamelloides]|uniref:DNAj n=1 Tax=Anaeramoeba flamelloides TaxID=1746091 RepID=A0AAV8AAH1_9EUKA|nr:DNAj [Anaeramoeba flamelloides]